MKNMWKDTAILFLITLLSGALLGIVYQVTKEPIQKQQERAKNEAYQEVFHAAQSFEEIGMKPDLAPETLSAYVREQGYDADIDEVAAALDADAAVLGYVVTVTDHEGYGGDIRFSVGITNEGKINGISILRISETAGLGMRAEEVLKPQFTDKPAGLFEVTKTGAAAPSQIDAISGATITSNAVTNGVNAAVSCFTRFLQEAATE